MAHDDIELLDAWRGGDGAAGNTLFERHFPAVRRFFRNKVFGDVDDLIQKTFLACVEGRDRFRGDAPFRGYLLGTANNILRVYYRRPRTGGDEELETLSMLDLSSTPSQAVAAGDGRRMVLEALRRVPLEYQIVLELFYWEDLPVADMATTLDIPIGTAKTRLRRGRQLLEEQLAAIETSKERLDATLTNLDDWARQLRDRMQSDP